ncbi:MAG: hypothetical protein JRI97_09395 [Deltaproteobacteria bacterium]|nr:hypothetical protein [Deltaproteobacteria bacterium]
MANKVEILVHASTEDAVRALKDLERQAAESFGGAAESAERYSRLVDRAKTAVPAAGAGGAPGFGRAVVADHLGAMESLRASWGLTWEEIKAGSVDAWEEVGRLSAGALSGINNVITSLMTGAAGASEAVRGLFAAMAAGAVAALVKIGVQRLVLAGIQKTVQAAVTAATTAGMAAIAAAAAPAAALTSIATAGGSAAAGAAAFTTAFGAMTAQAAGAVAASMGMAKGIMATAVFAKGGVVTRPTLGLFGEEGPEAVVPLSAGRRQEALSVLSRIAPEFGGPGGVRDVSVDITFSGPVHLSGDREEVTRAIGLAVEDAVRGALT